MNSNSTEKTWRTEWIFVVPRIAMDPSSGAEREAREPWNDPIGVRLAATITTSGNWTPGCASASASVVIDARRLPIVLPLANCFQITPRTVAIGTLEIFFQFLCSQASSLLHHLLSKLPTIPSTQFRSPPSSSSTTSFLCRSFVPSCVLPAKSLNICNLKHYTYVTQDMTLEATLYITFIWQASCNLIYPTCPDKL